MLSDFFFSSFPPGSNFVIGSLYPAYLPPHCRAEKGEERAAPPTP